MPTAFIAADQLSRELEQFLVEAPNSVVVEDGEVLFEFSTAHYAVSGEGKTVLHFWSEERNTVRRVLDAERKGRVLRLSVLRFGQSQPTVLEICADADRRTAASQRAIRARYQRLLERVLLRQYPGAKIEHLSSKPDLEHTFSLIYTRAVLRMGQSSFAVLGANAEETQAAIDASLSFGILWMDYQRQRLAGRTHVEGLKLFVPSGRAAVVRQRAAHLNHEAAKWQIFELDERSESCEELDSADTGNISTRLVHAVNTEAARQRFAQSIACIRELAPAADISVPSANEIVFRLYGLEFARARMVPAPASVRNSETILFGLGPAEYVLDDTTSGLFRELVQRVMQQRHPNGSSTNLFFRMCPERWLENLIGRDVRVIDERLDARYVYSQVPAFAASDRAMLDLLTSTLDGRLAILELKVDEDIHLALQGLDYWARVRWHQQHDDFVRHGYFAGRELSSQPPLLFLVAPALRVHPATDVLLRYLSPRIDWCLVRVDERWRQQLQVVNKRRAAASSFQVLPDA